MKKYDPDTRPDIDTWALGIAEAVAARGDCRKSRVGAVILDQNRFIVAAGYNGTPSNGQPGCFSGACPRALTDTPVRDGSYSDCIAIHAEHNAIRQAIAAGRLADLAGATIYVTKPPCRQCQALIDAYGITRTVCDGWTPPEPEPKKSEQKAPSGRDYYGVCPSCKEPIGIGYSNEIVAREGRFYHYPTCPTERTAR